MNCREFLNNLRDKHHDMLEGAVEYAFQRGDISSGEYDEWSKYIKLVEKKKTEYLLGGVK